jgi:hypothetical protein
MFEGNDISVFAGPMVTVLGTSLQNRDWSFHQLWGNWFRDGRILLSESHPVSLENKKSVPHDVKVRYAYYASDNPLETGSTLAADWNNQCKTDVFDYHKNIGTDFNVK